VEHYRQEPELCPQQELELYRQEWERYPQQEPELYHQEWEQCLQTLRQYHQNLDYREKLHPLQQIQKEIFKFSLNLRIFNLRLGYVQILCPQLQILINNKLWLTNLVPQPFEMVFCG
jgi:hypothetical protein